MKPTDATHPPAAFVPDCPGPVPDPRPARTALPTGACDSHIHVFGPYDRYPLVPGRGYTPPEASVDAYRRVQRRLGLSRAIVVQPSVYGADNACTLDAACRLGGPDRCRIVAVIDPDTPRRTLQGWHAAGVRGVRVNAVAGGGPLAAQIGAVAAAVAPLGWHVQLYLPREVLIEAVPVLRALPTEIVIDHLGDPDPQDPTGPGLTAVRRLLDGGRTWVKLSGGYIASREEAPWADVAPVAQALATSHPERLVWGSNWPHPVRFRTMPDDGDLLDALASGLGDSALLRGIMVENPACLYGFPLMPALANPSASGG